MNNKTETKLSIFMSLILRHKSKDFGVTLLEDGSCLIAELISAINSNSNWSGITKDNVIQVVNNCKKQRYAIEGDRIKANYGHSSVKIKREEKIPPTILYHGTNTKVVDLILKDGIKSMNREDVHMSEGLEFATLAGKRRGELVIVKIDAESAYNDGVKFFYAGNEVWLSDHIPPKYLTRG